MSYILDALNKSEQERERKQTPGLKSLQGEPPPSRFPLRYFLYALVLLVIFNSIGVFLYFGKDAQPAANATPVTESAPAQSLSIESPSMESLPVEAPASNISTAETPTTVTPIDPTATDPKIFPAAAIPASAVLIDDLPDHVKRRLPEVQITAHIYASDPDLRMVNINGVSRREGDLVSNSLQLVEITEVGVVMNFEGYAYEMDIVEDWQNSQ